MFQTDLAQTAAISVSNSPSSKLFDEEIDVDAEGMYLARSGTGAVFSNQIISFKQLFADQPKLGHPMKNQISLIITALICFLSTGCSLCCGPHDYDYPDFGGKHQRQDRRHGRVGSILSDPLAPRASGDSADSNLLAPPPLKSLEPVEGDFEPDRDEDVDDIKRDLEDITPLDRDGEDLPSLEELEKSNELDGSNTRRSPVNKKTRLIRNRPLR